MSKSYPFQVINLEQLPLIHVDREQLRTNLFTLRSLFPRLSFFLSLSHSLSLSARPCPVIDVCLNAAEPFIFPAAAAAAADNSKTTNICPVYTC